MRSLVFTFLICFIFSVKAQVLGIDFGTEFWKAALISPGKNLVIVENSRSERKTLNSVTNNLYSDSFSIRCSFLLGRL